MSRRVVVTGVGAVTPLGLGAPALIDRWTAGELGIDKAHAIASHPGVIFCSFGDMLRVPGSHGDLLQLKASGRKVALDLEIAPDLPRAVGDHDELTIVFQNLVDTPIRSTPTRWLVWTSCSVTSSRSKRQSRALVSASSFTLAGGIGFHKKNL